LDEAEKLITSKTKAIIVMHYGGYACDMQKALELQRKYGVKIIEDACHGPLSEYKGSKLGSIGAAGCFSFFANKNISTGEGGMLITNDEKIYQRAKLLRSHGMTTLSYDRAQGHSTNYDVVALGFNYRLDDIRSSIGIVQLKKLRCDIDKRIAIRGLYNDALRNIPGIIIPFLNYSEYSSTYIYPIILGKSLAGKRDALRVFLGEKGIQTSVHYPAVHRFSIYQDAKKGKLDKTEYISDNLITLPMYSSISEETVKFISQTICDFINA
jgi:dTDP-4-amino-4,6-dideoxygalactose transaminase